MNMIVLRAYPHQDVVHSDERYVLLTFPRAPMRLNHYEFTVYEDPLEFVRGGSWHQEEIQSPPLPITVERKSSRYSLKKTYECLMQRTGMYIEIRGGRIYEYSLTHANKVLSSQFYSVCAGEDLGKRWHFTKRDIPEEIPIAIPVTLPIPQIPQHIFRLFVESAIQKKEECPISMEPLTLQTVAGTPCGHLFHKDSIINIIRESGKCPTCRREYLCEKDLQFY